MGDLAFDEDIRLTDAGDLDSVSGIDSLKQSIYLRLMTPYGANVFHPEYGNKIFEILSETLNDDWLALAASYIDDCLKGETDITVTKILLTVSVRVVTIHIEYSSANNGNSGNIDWQVDTNG
mgnify:CR=1 FL=1